MTLDINRNRHRIGKESWQFFLDKEEAAEAKSAIKLSGCGSKKELFNLLVSEYVKRNK